MQRLQRTAAQPQITNPPKIHVPFGRPGVIKESHEQKRAEMGGGRVQVCKHVCVVLVGLLKDIIPNRS